VSSRFVRVFKDFRLVRKNITELFVLFLNEVVKYQLCFHWAMGSIFLKDRS
jgi:hypothetical protein